jgi:ADP-ribose pyrophosphatase
MIDKDESKESVAIREADEEAGLKVKHLEPMLNYLSSPGGTTERIYVYLAIVDSSEAGGVHGLAHEQEDIRVQVLHFEESMMLLEKGVIDNAATVIALQWLALNKSKVDSEFS